MTQWVEIKKGDKIVFNSGHGKGSVVKVKNKGHYFMPAKVGMRLSGDKSPIARYEEFVVTDLDWFKFKNKYVHNCYLTRCHDNVLFIVSYDHLQRYFSKTNRSSLG